ncbi:tight adherence protein B [Solimonas aquatica]|uniref:Tight adherence protein B n=1 Tax=Solimonas aquatica TaxID=489703 RepID=A0A1H9MJN1_9GAMM|nr:type II secretion system F family protein [Solimonas aquatica]SER23914.1 tight adherence protein B [Solimonas aquatica]
MSASDQLGMLLPWAIALSAALLTWVLVEACVAALARYRASFTNRTRFQLREFFLFIDPRKLFVANIAAIFLTGVLTWIASGNIPLAMFSAAAVTMAPRLIYAWTRQRRLRRFEEQLPDALMMISGGLKAGLGLSSALQQLVAEGQPPLTQEFSLLLREQRVGLTLDQALENLTQRVPIQTTLLVVSAMKIASETGGGLAETLERTSHTLRSRLQMEGKIRALTAQGKLQGWVVGLLPLSLLVILDRMEPDTMQVLWHSYMGWGALAVVAVLEVLGIYMIRKIVNIDV